MSIPTALNCWERNWIEEHHCIYYDCTWCNSSVQSLAEFCSFVIPFNLKAAVQEWSFRLSSDHSSKSTLNKLSRSLRMFLKPIVQPADLALWLKWDGFASQIGGQFGKEPLCVPSKVIASKHCVFAFYVGKIALFLHFTSFYLCWGCSKPWWSSWAGKSGKGWSW